MEFRKIGLVLGANNMNLITPKSISQGKLYGIDFNMSSHITLGSFVDLPIQMTPFSLNFGVNFTQSSFYGSYQILDTDTDIFINTKSIDLPVLIRYAQPRLNWRPFVNLGPTFLYNFQDDNIIYETKFNGSHVTIDALDHHSVISKFMYGGALGFGIQKKLDFRKRISAELRYHQYFGLDHYGETRTLNANQIRLLIGISI